MQIPKLVQALVNVLDEHKATSIVSMKVKKLSDVAEYMIVCSATSGVHVKALLGHVEKFIKDNKIGMIGVEIDVAGEWALIDTGDVLINIMQPVAREMYNLEELWEGTSSSRIGKSVRSKSNEKTSKVAGNKKRKSEVKISEDKKMNKNKKKVVSKPVKSVKKVAKPVKSTNKKVIAKKKVQSKPAKKIVKAKKVQKVVKKSVAKKK